MVEADKNRANVRGRAGDDLVAAYPPPEWDVVLSLPAVQATALVFVDYALYGARTPTSWPRDVAQRVPEDVESDWRLLRPIIAHGTVWRDFVLFRIGPDDVAQRDWDAFREWAASLTDAEMRDLVVEGVVSGLRYYREMMKPMPAVEELLAPLGMRAPDRSALADDDALRAAVAALVASWQAPVEPVVELGFDFSRVRHTLLRMLDAVWDGGFGEAWTANLPRLRRAVVAATRRLEEAAGVWGSSGSGGAAPAGLSELVLKATGRQLASSVLDQMQGAGRVVFFPSIELGQYVAVEEAGYGWSEQERPGEWRVFFEPLPQAAGARSGRAARTAMSSLSGDPALDAGEEEPALGENEPTALLDVDEIVRGLEALGDRTRLAIVQSLHEHGEMFTGEVAERLGVHASTASRHLAQLESAQLVRVRRDGKLKFYTLDPDKIRAIAAFLQNKFM